MSLLPYDTRSVLSFRVEHERQIAMGIKTDQISRDKQTGQILLALR